MTFRLRPVYKKLATTVGVALLAAGCASAAVNMSTPTSTTPVGVSLSTEASGGTGNFTPYAIPSAFSEVSGSGGSLGGDDLVTTFPVEVVTEADQATSPTTAGDAQKTETTATVGGESNSSPASDVNSDGLLVVESVGLSAPLKTQKYEPVLTPGDHDSAWMLVDEEKGWTSSTDSLSLVTTHACSLQHCPGNHLLTDDNKAAVKAGDMLHMNGDAYEITTADIVNKDEVVDGSYYKNEPGRLLVVTCRPNADGKVASATHNVVIVAQLVEEDK